jgi:serine/threonine protein phosphatase 1
MIRHSHQLIQPSPGQRVFFCGDVHGDLVALKKQLRKVGFIEAEDMLIFKGDLIDRGDYSKELIEFVCGTPFVYSTLGNHELMFLQGLKNPLSQRMHLANGGDWIENIRMIPPVSIGNHTNYSKL